MIARNYVLSALEHSMNLTNKMIGLLENSHTTKENFVVRTVIQNASIPHYLEILTDIWEEMLDHAEKFQWKESISKLQSLNQATHR